MARDIKDEKIAETEGPVTPDAPQPIHPMQLQVTESQEKMLVMMVTEDHDSSMNARNKRDYGTTAKGLKMSFDEWFKDLTKMYNGERIPKVVPWKFCSNRSLRITASILDMLHARFYSAVINEDLARWRPGSTEDVPKVERVSKIMHWWVWVRSRLQPFFDRWIKTTIGYGDSLTESQWKVRLLQTGTSFENPVLGPDQQPLNDPDGTPSVVKGFEPNRIESSVSKTYTQEQFLFQEGSTNVDEDPVIIMETVFYRDLEKGEAEGKFKNIESQLKTMLPVAMPKDSAITEEESQAFRDVKVRNMPVKITKEYLHFDADGDGFPEDVLVYISIEHKLYLGGVKVSNLTYSGKRALDLTKFEDRLDKPAENRGMGVIEKSMELAKEIDAIFNQMNDGNTLSVMNDGYYDPGGNIDAPVMKRAPNKMTPVSDPQRNIYFPPINIPTEKMLNAIRLVLEFIERLTAASSFTLGKQDELAGGSGTATRTNAIVSAAEQRFALPATRLREGASRILTNHLDLLQKNIPPDLEKRILGEDNEPVFKPNEVSAVGIAGEFDAYLLTDPAQGSKQTERELSGMLYSLLLQNIIVGTDPAKIYKVTADLITAHGKDPEEYLGPAPDFDATDSPDEENTLLVQGDFSRVKAQITENHIEHIRVHQDLLTSPTMAEMASVAPNLHAQIMQALQAHMQEHQQMMQVMLQVVNQFGGSGGGNVGGEGPGGAGPNDQGVPGIGGSPGVAQIPGPLGEALNTKRDGESRSPAGG